MTSRRNRIDVRLAAAAVAAACAIAGAHAADAKAFDTDPCGKQHAVKWTDELVRAVPLAGLVDGKRVPVYTNRVANPPGKTIPAPRTFIGAASGTARFICETRDAKAVYYHPGGWRNMWWARTVAADGKEGWVPEVFFKGGGGDESDIGLRACEKPKPPPSPPSPPENPCEPTPVAQGVQLRAAFADGDRVRTARYGRRPQVNGSLVGPDGAPVAGAAVCVGVQDSSDGPVNATGSVTTDANGRFAYKPDEGASRRVWFVHRTGGAAAAANVDLRVRAPVRFRSTRRALRNGQSTLFRGRIGGASDTGGLIVELQYPQRSRWQTFATVHVGREGRFRYRYRFTRTVGSRIYRLRARVPAQRGYPFVAGKSRKVRVLVAG